MANKAIKGITVEIGGDTTKLGKALESSEKKSRSLQTELYEVQKALKFDPTNVDLLSQKQTILTQNIDESLKKLDTLKEAEKQVIAQFERGEVAEDQVRALKREIIKAEKSLDYMETELNSTTKALKDLADGTDNAEKHTKDYKDSVEKAKKELSEFKDKAKDALDTIGTTGAVIGGAITAAGGYALKLTTDFDKAFNTLITRTGATADETDELNASMEQVYSNNYGESIEDVAVSMATVKNNTKLAGEELQDVTEYALLMRDTFDFEVNESTRSAKMLMDQYGLSAKDAYNLIAQGAQNGLDKNGDLLDTINEYAVHFNQLGIDAPTMFNMLVNGADNGTFSVDKLGDAVKEFGIRVKDGSDSTAEAFTSIGLDADKMVQKFAKGGDDAQQALNETVTALFNLEDPIAQNTAGVSLFGTMWEDLGVDAVKSLMNVDGQVAISKDALNQINEQKYDDIGSALQGLGRTVETDIIQPLGEELKPVVEDAIEYVKTNGPQIKEILSKIVSKVGEFVRYVVDNGPTIISVIGGIGAGFVTWKVASLINGVVKAIKAFKLASEGATVAQWAMNVAMNANPIGIIVTLIAGLVTAFILLWQNCEGFRNFWIGLWEKIKEITGAVIDALIVFFTETIPTAISNFVEKMKSFFTTAVNFVLNIISQLPTGFQLVFHNVKNILDNFVNIFINIFNIIKTVVQTVISVIKAIFTGDFASIGDIVSEALEKIKGFFSSIFDSIVTIIINWIAIAINYFRGLGESIGAVFVKIGEMLVSWWDSIKTFFTVKVPEIIKNIVEWFKELPTKIKNAISSAVTKIGEWGVDMKDKAVTGIKNMVTGVINTAKELPSKFVTVGKDIISGLWNGISGAVSGLYSNIKNALSGLVDKAKDALGIHSPSRVFADVIGKQIPAGIAQGIDDNTNVANQAVEAMTDDLTKEAVNLNGATINRKLNTTFTATANIGSIADVMATIREYGEKLIQASNRSIILDSGVLVGETIGTIDNALADRNKQILRGW